MAEMLSSLDKMFEILTALLTFMVAVILGILLWMTKTSSDFWILSRFTASLVIPYLVMVLFWFWSVLASTQEMKIRIKLIAWSMLSFIFMYYVEMFSILVLLRLIANFPTLSAFILMGIITLASYFPYRKVMLRYRAATLNLPFWSRGNLMINFPYFIGIFLAFGLIMGALLLL